MAGLGVENMALIAVYKEFIYSDATNRWYVNTLKCYSNGRCYAITYKGHNKRYAWSKHFTNRDFANRFVKRYIDMGFKKQKI